MIEDLTSNVYFNWSLPKIGFGQLSVDWNRETGQYVIGNEMLRREKVRELLIAWANKVADEGAMDCPNFDEDDDPRNIVKKPVLESTNNHILVGPILEVCKTLCTETYKCADAEDITPDAYFHTYVCYSDESISLFDLQRVFETELEKRFELPIGALKDTVTEDTSACDIAKIITNYLEVGIAHVSRIEFEQTSNNSPSCVKIDDNKYVAVPSKAEHCDACAFKLGECQFPLREHTRCEYIERGDKQNIIWQME